MTKEEYEKNLIRYFDSVRTGDGDPDNIGQMACCGVLCGNCMFESICYNSTPQYFFNYIDKIEKWTKEHPMITNKDKFKEIFGEEPNTECCPPISHICEYAKYASDCNACRRWWDEEYKEPNSEVTECD